MSGDSAHSWLNKIWYERRTPPWWLLPPAALFGAISALRRFAYARRLRRSTRLPRPVIVVGNLSVGGTGKTPLVCWLIEQLQSLGMKPGVLTRGYGGTARAPQLVFDGDDPIRVGDESVLLARRTRVPVAIGKDRPAAAQLLIAVGCDVIVSDDGLQHYALQRDCEIVVVDAERGFGNQRLLPAGPLRETPARLKQVDLVVLNGAPRAAATAEFAGALHMRVRAISATTLLSGATCPLDDFAGKSVHAVAGIGNPRRFFNMLRSHGIEVLAHPLADHAQLQPHDITFADGRAVLMTEKDAVKCGNMAGPEHWYVPISASFDAEESAQLMRVVTDIIQSRAGGA